MQLAKAALQIKLESIPTPRKGQRFQGIDCCLAVSLLGLDIRIHERKRRLCPSTTITVLYHVAPKAFSGSGFTCKAQRVSAKEFEILRIRITQRRASQCIEPEFGALWIISCQRRFCPDNLKAGLQPFRK